MFELLRDLSDWVAGFAESDWAYLLLGVSSFIESIFFPIPPDPLLIAISVKQPHNAIWLGVLVTLTSVAGALVGHWIGGRFGRPLMYRFLPTGQIKRVEELLTRFGVWAILVFAISPLPYKVFALSAGVLGLDRRTFVVVSLVGRGARFMTLGVLLFFYGASIERFISDNFELLTIIFLAALVAAALGWGLLRGRRRPKDALQ